MKPYLTYSAEDLACDEDFLSWIKNPEEHPELEAFWRKWLEQYPYKQEVVDEARFLVQAVLAEGQYLPGEIKQQALWKRIEATAMLRSPARILPLWQRWYSWAAAVSILSLSVSLGWLAMDARPDEITEIPTLKTDPQFSEHVNNSDLPKTIILSDGTSIILQPHSILTYPETFDADSREVSLRGQAFFEVTRDPNRPFLVLSGEVVTRVLGTSFTVRNIEGEDNVLIQVKTGKVSVFLASEKVRSTQPSEKAVDGVVLMPNQQVVYERVPMKMTKSLVENPTVLIPLAKHSFQFEDAPIKEVFMAIEEAYGVEIVFDEEALSSCYLNASLDNVPLYDKLKLICRGINTTYEIMDSHIIIYGKGCHEDDTANPKPM